MARQAVDGERDGSLPAGLGRKVWAFSHTRLREPTTEPENRPLDPLQGCLGLGFRAGPVSP